MKPVKRFVFTRRSATDNCCCVSYPALKGRAKVTSTLRVGYSKYLGLFRQKLIATAPGSDKTMRETAHGNASAVSSSKPFGAFA